MASFHDLTAETLEGETFSFADLKGKRVMIVNTASRCGYTPQYKPSKRCTSVVKTRTLSSWASHATNLVVKSRERHLTFVNSAHGTTA